MKAIAVRVTQLEVRVMLTARLAPLMANVSGMRGNLMTLQARPQRAQSSNNSCTSMRRKASMNGARSIYP